MARKKEVSVRTIARECSVSVATVSRVLHGGEGVREETRRRVMEVVEKYHYPLPQERAQREAPAERGTVPAGGRVPKIAILNPASVGDYFTRLQQEIEEHFMAQGVTSVVASTNYNPERLPAVLSTLYDCGVEGVVLISSGYLQVKDMIRRDIPHVWIDCNDDPQVTGEICQVQSDHYIAGRMAASELVRCGCYRPIVLSSPKITHRSLDRRRGFLEVFDEAGIRLDPQETVHRLYSSTSRIFLEAQERIRYLSAAGTEFDGIFAINDLRALGAFMGCQSVGLRIPEEVKLIGFDGISETARSLVRVTSVMQDAETISRIACEMLERQMRGEQVQERRAVVPVSLYHGVTLPVSSLYYPGAAGAEWESS